MIYVTTGFDSEREWSARSATALVTRNNTLPGDQPTRPSQQAMAAQWAAGIIGGVVDLADGGHAAVNGRAVRVEVRRAREVNKK
jgi:hypothetical protein